MAEVKLTLGKAIDQIIEALSSFEDKDRRAIISTVCQHLQIESGSVEIASHQALPANHHPASSKVAKPREIVAAIVIRAVGVLALEKANQQNHSLRATKA